jgi:6-phosphogluconolactonase
MICNHMNGEGMSGAAGPHCRRLLKRALRGMAWMALGGMMGGCSGVGGTVASGSGGGGPVPELAFAIDGIANTVSVFIVDTTIGAWTEVGSIATGTTPLGVAVHPSGKFLYVANSNSANISAYKIDATSGVLTPITGSPFAVVGNPAALTIDSSGSFLYTQTLTTVAPVKQLLSGFVIDATSGALTAVVQPTVNGNTTFIGLTFVPTTEILYAAEPAPLNNVLGFAALPTTGVLAPAPGPPTAEAGSPFGIAGHPTGKFVYVTNNANSDVSGYSVDASSGRLTAVPMSPFTSGTAPGAGPQAVAVERTGKFLYVVNAGEVDISEYSIDAMSGKLTQLTGSPLPLAVGTIPLAMAVEPSGSFLYVVNNLGNNIAVFMIQSDGSLNPLGTMLTGAGNVTAIGFRPGHP